MASLVQSGMYGANNTDYTTINWFYVVKFSLEAYTLQNNTQIDVQTISSGGLVVKAQYAPCKKTPIVIGKNSKCNRLP